MSESVIVSDILVNDVISFQCFGSVIPNQSNVTIVGTSYSGTVLRSALTAAINHANIYSSLPITPTQTSNDYTKYDYILVQTSTGSLLEIGIPWINQVTLTRLQRSTIIASIQDVDPSQVSALNTLLTQNGFNNVSFTVVSS